MPDAAYCEHPFDPPIVGREGICACWKRGATWLRDKSSAYDILSVEGNCGIARWQGWFTVVESGKRMALDCLFVVEFNDVGLCQVFREWWHIREAAA